jgi:hypothetical protein
MARSRAAFFETSLWARTASAICLPTEYTGLSEVSGSWKIIAILLPRTSVYSFSVMPSSSLPRNRTDPAMRAFLGNRPMSAIELTDLPEPDSPTMPMASPERNV